MAADFAILFGWKSTIPGREKVANAAFGEFVGYLTGMQKEHRIESFEPVILAPNGGALQGFFLIRGEHEKLSELRWSDGWRDWMTRGITFLDGLTVVEGYVGKSLEAQMARFGSVVSKL